MRPSLSTSSRVWSAIPAVTPPGFWFVTLIMLAPLISCMSGPRS